MIAACLRPAPAALSRLLFRFITFCVLAIATALSVEAIPAVRILPLGDSITSGCCTDTDIEGGYRTELYRMLTSAGYNVDFVGTIRDPHPPATLGDPDHEGHGGYQIRDIDAGIEKWLGAMDDPDVILLLIGTNDYSDLKDSPRAIDRLDNLITHLADLRPFAKIIVANLLRRADKPASDLAIQTTFNPHVPEIVARQASLGVGISFVDLRACCDGPTDLASDRLHPSLSGFSRIAGAWFEAVTDVISPLGTAEPPAIMRIAGHVDLRHVIVTMSKPVEDDSTALAHFRLSGGLTVLRADLDNSKRVLTLTTSPQSAGTAYSLTVTGVRDRTPQGHIIAPGSTASFDSGRIAEAVNYTLVYSLDLPSKANYNTTGVPYQVDRRGTVGAFGRVAYYLELQQSGGPLRYLWVSMDPFTSDPGKIGVPSDQTGAFFQQPVANMSVRSSVPGIVTGDRLTGGNIEFWAGNYQTENSANVPNASDSVYDWGDTAMTTATGYGSMQIHNHSASQTLFAFNGWGGYGSYGVDLGIGNSTGASRDWTYAQNAAGYIVKQLQVYVWPGMDLRSLLVGSANPSSGMGVRVGPSDSNHAGNGVTPFTRVYAPGTIVSLSAPLITEQNSPFQKWQKDGVDFSTKPSVSLVMDGTHSLIAIYAAPPAVKRSLTVNSSNPNSGVTVDVAPVDVTRAGDGVTPFTRSYAQGAILTLAAPRTVGANTFKKWQKDGVDFSTNPSISLAMESDHTLTAIYMSATTATRSLTVSSANPGVGVPVTITPGDVNRAGGGVTPFARSYAQGAILSLAAPRTVGSSTFKKWQMDGIDFSTNPSISLAMDRDHSLTAIYGSATTITRSLAVRSTNPGAGVSVTITPADLDGAGAGVTPIARSYAQGAILSLAAPRMVGSSTFKKWQKDGVDFSTNPSISLAMEADHTLTAIYGSATTITRSLAVRSTDPGAGVSVAIAPADLDGAVAGVTPFARSYAQGAILSLAASRTVGSSTFKKWQKDGVDFSTNPSISLAMEADHTLTAIYVSATTVTRSLTVDSANPSAGVSVSVAPADLKGAGAGMTPFTRSYAQGAILSLAAPRTVGSSTFKKWQRDGADFSTNPSISLAMDVDHALTAVY